MADRELGVSALFKQCTKSLAGAVNAASHGNTRQQRQRQGRSVDLLHLFLPVRK
eukprot:CAMPEP_0184439224 /NCGR_PEP_ID=MMETSP0738-20130409/697903_1 /TAXON_ID=385413 /ORGANISM="Thalassiosira miniscula, Strain CCMP1093" /LENGTH=53 /DNA_ID=CAMNT_0026806793 /DNA_START=50 /DNA_END=208 /DNA_ORIENTATION=+